MSTLIGTVIRMMVRDTIPPKIKRFIIVGASADTLTLASVYINTELNIKVNYNLDLRCQHIEFDVAGRDYLDHTSFVDCSKLKIIEREELCEIIRNRPAVVIGHLSVSDLELVRRQIVHSPTIKGKIKKRYGFY
ncbi:hypothetical protein GCM10010967_30580 [Dyadobacter beijingensis]|uniref:LytTr DNA-binding domain-containing protein n=1 Tax=Dyadobacter beijingensis TaxID=365489 RepID=A0ABQ2I139_9BACT|nr:hypothetical protein [Dyadobacter beijingensis]GGM95079.1 hypothetical protein GCM10010967_30580 [Dyadobacter beijingensis]